MQSIAEIYDSTVLAGCSHIALFRCKKTDQATYARNVEWLKKGKTGRWRIANGRKIDGVVILLDAATRGQPMEVWAGRFRNKVADGAAWVLQVQGRFERLGVLDAHVKPSQFMQGHAIGQGATYLDKLALVHPRAPAADKALPERCFRPEYAGDRISITPMDFVREYPHARVVSALKADLEAKGFTAFDNARGHHDLTASSPRGIPYLYEVKSDATTTSLFTAVGQLMLYEQMLHESLCKVLVMPRQQGFSQQWGDALEQLDISVMFYEEDQGAYTFSFAQ